MVKAGVYVPIFLYFNVPHFSLWNHLAEKEEKEVIM